MRLTLLLPVICFALCSSSLAQSLCFPVDEEGFEDASGWTHEGIQTDVNITNGAMIWNTAQCGVYDRWWRPLNWPLADACFKAEFTLTVQPNPQGSGAGACVFAATAGTLDPLYYDNSQAYASTPQDGLLVLLVSDGTSNNDIDTWFLEINEKDGVERYYPSAPDRIYLDASISTYYAVFERLSATGTELRVYTDEQHTVLYDESTFGIHSSVVGLTTLQAGVATGGTGSRQFNGTLDDITICHCENTIGIMEAADPGPSLVLRTIAPGLLSVGSQGEGMARVKIMDVQGREVESFSMNARDEARIVPLTAGIYLVGSGGGGLRAVERVVIQ